MQCADLYIRVSTDEQADKGYSQRNQEEMLRRYCVLNMIEVRKVIYEDHSAKTFNRPEWQKLLQDLRKHRGQADLILFTKWDRFSRNAGDAYQMINLLRKLGADPQAIEQPLDLSIPENKMMLAFYLAAPEVENDRRALNTFFGMRRAKKEGRWMATAPTGYINKISEDGRKYIAINEPQASIMRWSFETLAKGIYNVEQVFKQAKIKGLTSAKSNFHVNLRNPIYCGKIFIPKHKDEESHLVKGQHEPLVSESLFYDVQDVLDGRKRHYRTKVVANAILPLRGFLICPDCGKMLTGSKSKGRGKDYFYYHCYLGCNCRFRAELVNDKFSKELRKHTPSTKFEPLFTEFVQEAWHSQTGFVRDEKKHIIAQIRELEEKLTKARDWMFDNKIDTEDYRKMKSETAAKISRLEANLAEFSGEEINIDGLLSEGIANTFRLDSIYDNGDIIKKREVIGSMYPEKLTFDGNLVRTTRINEAVRIICSLDKACGGNKKGQNGGNSTLSCLVTASGFKPETPSSVVRYSIQLSYAAIHPLRAANIMAKKELAKPIAGILGINLYRKYPQPFFRPAYRVITIPGMPQAY